MLSRYIKNSVSISFGFAKRLQKKAKERTHGISVSDEKMIKLTTKEEGKSAEKDRVRNG